MNDRQRVFWLMDDERAIQVFDRLREEAERAVKGGGYLPYWSGYLAGLTAAVLDLSHPLPTEESDERPAP